MTAAPTSPQSKMLTQSQARITSTSSTDSFRSAHSETPAINVTLGTPSTAYEASDQDSLHLARPPLPRSRWFFQKEKSVPIMPTPPRPPKRPRPKPPLRQGQLPLNSFSTPPRSPSIHSVSTIAPLASHHTPSNPPNSSSPTPDIDDWALDELPDDSVHDTPIPSLPDPSGVSSSINLGQRDTLTLRAFDESHDQAQPSTSVNYLIGVYDPAAQTDDWGDDFELEEDDGLPSDSSRTFDAVGSFPPWILEQHLPPSEARSTMQWPPPHAEYPPTTQYITSPDHSLPMRPVPHSAFATPTLSHSSLLMFPEIGYDARALHPSCLRVKQLFSRHHATIRTHFDALVRDCGGTVALDHTTRDLYLLSGDQHLASLHTSNKDLSVQILLWKLEWANLNGNLVERSLALLALSDLHKNAGNLHDALSLIEDALNCLFHDDQSSLSIALAAELEYEKCILHRGSGAVAEAGRALKRAVAHSEQLTSFDEYPTGVKAPQQRGVWWQLRCKFLQAEMAYDLGDHDTAVQHYSEYIVESITRMIGVTAPPSSGQTLLGAQFMRYCLFSPRRLVLALWTTVISLGEMKSFAAAAEVASFTGFVATAFGYEDGNEAALAVRARIKDIGTELNQQYEVISKSILQRNAAESNSTGAPAGQDRITASPFNYNAGKFADVTDDIIEDWDAQIERELNISINRCDGDRAPTDDMSFSAPEGIVESAAKDVQVLPLSSHTRIERAPSSIHKWQEMGADATARQIDFSTGIATQKQSALIETQLRQYLSRLTGAASAISAQQIYPKPTQPFDGHLLGPREHEDFFRMFVRAKDPVLARRIDHGLPVTPQWHPSAVCKLNFDIEPTEEIHLFNSNVDVLSPKWGLRLLEAVWKVVRSQVPLPTKRSRVRRLIVNSFSRASSQSRKKPAHDEKERCNRLEMLAALLDVLKLARELVTNSGKEAVWFSRACIFLGVAAATVTPAAKAAVELFQAESRAHCGVKAVVSAVTLDKCKNAARQSKEGDLGVRGGSSSKLKRVGTGKSNDIPSGLRQSVVDIMHALYWRTKAGFDESCHTNTLEKLLHADVVSSLYLTGCSISPVDGSPIDLSKEVSILQIPSKARTKEEDPGTYVDETRRVSSSELIVELQSLWSSLPSSAGIVRAKVSWALAHHSKVDQRDYARAERFLFDGLRSLDAVTKQQVLPNSFFSRVLHASPVSLVASPLAGSLLELYGSLTLSHSKYRYGIAAHEAATDGRRVRNMDKRAYRSSVIDVVDAALQNSDWRRAVMLLHNLRHLVHPKNGLRNEFVQLCIRLHSVCFDIGCFDASIVPLRAYSALVFEERLRVLLQRYKRRLAKKTRSKFRRYISGTPLPKLLPGSSVFANRKNPLASFFETPLVTAAIDSTLRHSSSVVGISARKSSFTSPKLIKPRNSETLKTFESIFWPLRVPFWSTNSSKSSAKNKVPGNPKESETHPSPDKETKESPSKGIEPPGSQNQNLQGVVNGVRKDSEFEEEQRELFRIAAEQEVSADSDRFRVELLRAQTDFAKADFEEADLRCMGLLEVSKVHSARYQVLEIMARIRLKRREIAKCLECLDQIEHEHSLYNKEVSNGIDQEKKTPCPPQVTFLRLSALIHGARLDEAHYLADKALDTCDEHSFWNQGRLHYLRGKVLYETCTPSTAPSTDPFKVEDESKSTSPKDAASVNLKMVELTMTAFETASQYFDAAGDEICAAKSDLLWARTCIDFLFRRVVLPSGSGGGWPLKKACLLYERRINLDDVLDTVYNVINVASTSHIPLLLIDAMAAMAETKCIQGQPSSIWSFWVSQAWNLFSRLFTDAEDLTVVLTSIAPVSVLEELRNLCGRLVRLVMCDRHTVNVSDMNKHLRLFEAYVTLQLSIDQKMNLASVAHRKNSAFTAPHRKSHASQDSASTKSTTPPGRRNGTPAASPERRNGPSQSGGGKYSFSSIANDRKMGNTKSDARSDRISEAASDRLAHRRPAGAFLHLLGNEGVALGKQGFSLLNRPRQQVISAVKGTGAVLIPSNFFANSKMAPSDGQVGRDAEMIFPFKPSLGLGAMQILDDEAEGEEEFLGGSQLLFPKSARNSEVQRPREGNQMNGQDAPVQRKNEPQVAQDDDIQQQTPHNLEEIEAVKEEISPVDAANGSGTSSTPKSSNGEPEEQEENVSNSLASLIRAVRDELDGGNVQTKGSSSFFGADMAHRIWAHLHRINRETRRYIHGEISMEQLQARNGDALQGWVQCIPHSPKEWTVPDSIGRRLVYILYAHGVIGYYVVERGGSIERVAFGGKQDDLGVSEVSERGTPTKTDHVDNALRSTTEVERLYLLDLVKGFKRDDVWHKDRDTGIVSGMASNVLRAPRSLLSSASPAQKSRSRPIVLIADLPLQILPWELFFDHVVIRSHTLLEVIRSLQEDPSGSQNNLLGNDDTAVAAVRKVVRFINFGASRKELVDLEKSEDTRRQQLAFQSLLRLNHMNSSSIAAYLDLRGFSDPTSLNAIVRSTGPLSSPLSQSRKAVRLLGLRVVAHIGRRNYPHVDFLRVPHLSTASMWDLKEAAMIVQPSLNDKDEPRRDLGAYIPVFMFSYADLVDASESVFGLRRVVPNGILMFTPATHMKVLARHLEDEELSAELGRASGRLQNRIFPDVVASARVLVESVSRFSREKRIPIVVFLGQGLVDVFPGKRATKVGATHIGILG